MAAKHSSSSTNSKDLHFDNSEVQCPSYTIAFGQLQDLVRTQTSLATRLKYTVSRSVSKDYGYQPAGCSYAKFWL